MLLSTYDRFGIMATNCLAAKSVCSEIRLILDERLAPVSVSSTARIPPQTWSLFLATQNRLGCLHQQVFFAFKLHRPMTDESQHVVVPPRRSDAHGPHHLLRFAALNEVADGRFIPTMHNACNNEWCVVILEDVNANNPIKPTQGLFPIVNANRFS